MTRERATAERRDSDGSPTPAARPDAAMRPEAGSRDGASPRTVGLIFFGITALAFLLRWVHLLQSRVSVFFDTPTADGRAYIDWSQRIVAGDWLGREVFYQAPLYPYFLALVQLLVGQDMWWVRLTQAVVGAASCGLIFLSGRAFFSTAVGVAAGITLAVYPPAIFFDGLIQKAGVGLFWMALMLWLTARVQQRPTAAYWAGVGAVLGLLCLTRENALLLLPVLVLWLVLRFGDRPAAQRARWMAGFAGGLAAVLLPIGIRNLAVGGEFTLTTSQAGSNFYIGNNPDAYGIYVPLKRGRGDASRERDDALALAEDALGRELSPGQVSRYWFGRSWEFIRKQPGAWLMLLGRKFMFTLNAYEIPDSHDQYFYATFCPLIRRLGWVGHFGVLFPLGAAGLVLTWPRRRDAWVLYAGLATITVGVAAFFVFARYRFPLVPLLAIFAAAALVEGYAAVAARRFARVAIAASVLAAAAVFSNLPPGRIDKDSQIAMSHTNTAITLADLRRYEEAIQHGRAAIEIQPRLVEAYVALGRAHAGLRQPRRAIQVLRRALAIWPDYASALFYAGKTYMQLGRWNDAADALRRAVQLDPANPETTLEWAWLLAVCPDASLRNGATAAEMVHPLCAPDGPLHARPRGLDVLAAALAEQGRFDDALNTARRAIELTGERPMDHDSLRDEIAERIKLYESGLPYRLPEE